MTTLAELILKANYAQIDKAKDAMDGLTHAGRETGRVMRETAALLGVAFGIKEVLEAADAYKTFTNRLALVTDGSEQLAAAQGEVFRIAQETRQPLAETAEVYQRLATNAGALGITLNEVGATTERINKLMVISGTSGASAAAALTQLGQAFASGTLRGEELNSVLEQAPALAKAIADGMGVTVGQLRQLGQDGKITAQAVIEALQKQGDAIQAQFDKMSPTLSQSVNQIGNSFVRLIGRIDDVSGATTGLGLSIGSISRAMDNLDLGPAIQLWGTWAESIDSVRSGMDQASGRIADFGVMLDHAFGGVGEMLITLLPNIVAMVQSTTVALTASVEGIENRIQRAKDRISAVFTDDTLAAAQQRYLERQRQIDSAKLNTVEAIMSERDAEIALGKARRESYELWQKYMTGDTSSLDQKPKGKAASPVDEKAKKEAEKQAKWVEQQRIHWSNQISEQMDFLERQGQMEQESYQRKLSDLLSAYGSEEEIEKARYEKKLAGLSEYIDLYNLTEQQGREARERLEAEHVANMAQIKAAEAARDKTSLSNRLGATKKFLDDIYAATGSSNERMLRLIKAVGAAQALANAYIGASQTLADPSLPFYVKIAAALQVVATGIGFANAISGSGGSGAAAPSATPSSPDTTGISSATPAARAQVVDFRIERRGRRGWDDEDVAELMKAMGERVSDGAKFGRIEFVTA